MTKKSKIEVTQPVVDDQPIDQPAVVEEPASAVLDAKVIVPKVEKKKKSFAVRAVDDLNGYERGLDDDLWLMPEPYPTADAGRRERHHSPSHVPVVEVAGKIVEVTEVAEKDIPQSIRSKMAIRQDMGSSRFHYRSQPRGNWPIHDLIDLFNRRTGEGLKYYTAEVDGVKIYLTSGSTLIVANTLYSSRVGYEGPNVTIQEGCTLIMTASVVTVDSLTLEGVVILRNSVINCKGGVSIGDSMLRQSTIDTKSFITITDTALSECRLVTDLSTVVLKSHATGIYLSGMGSIVLEHIDGASGFSFTCWGEKRLAFHASHTYLNEFSYDYHQQSGQSALSDYKALARSQPWNSEETINITRRVDYGFFSANGSIPFIRMNHHDIMVGGKIFSVQEFFPEFLTKKEPAPREPAAYPFNSHWPAPVTPSFTGPGYYSRESEIWQRAASIAFGNTDKPVIGKLGESIVNGLLDQIRSRINVYVEISTLN